MAKNALKYYNNAVYHLEHIKKLYICYMNTMDIPKNRLLSVMDIGVGSGRVFNEVLLPLLPKNVSQIVLSDMDEEMVKFAHSITKDSRVRSEILNMTDEKMPEHLQGKFDLLFSSYCFSYLRDLRRGFQNSGKLLKPEGQILNMFQYKTNALYTTYKRMSKLEKWNKLTKDYANYKPHLIGENPEKELKKIFEDINMKLIKYEFDESFQLNATKKQILEAYRSLDAKYLQIPKLQQEAYMKDFLEIFSEETDMDFCNGNLEVPIWFNFPSVILTAENIRN